MKLSVFVVGALAVMGLFTDAEAQDCRRCTQQASVQACIDCNMAAGGYTMQQSQKWCRKNQPLCTGKTTRKK
jgi:hypothetical protein